MTVTFYANNSDTRVVNKNITPIGSSVTCNPYKECSIIAPVLILAGEISATVNYMYIDKFDRYYYITNMVYNGNQTLVYGRVDTLMSYATQIIASTQFVSRSENKGSTLIPDTLMPTTCENVPTCIAFGNNMRTTENYVIGVI